MRFIATRCGGIGDRTFGVWDVARQEWRSSERMRSEAAEALAAELNLEDGFAGPRPVSHRRVVKPARAVEVNLGIEWRPGKLIYWVREPAGWFGYAHVDVRGEADWYPSDRLRLPAGDSAQ